MIRLTCFKHSCLKRRDLPFLKEKLSTGYSLRRDERNNAIFRLAPLVILLFGLMLVSGCELLPELPGSAPEQFRPEGEYELPEPPSLPPDAGDVRRGILFYPDEEQRFLVPVIRAIPWTEGIAMETLNHLVASPELDGLLETVGLAAPLPAGTEILGLTINEGVARVDFNVSFLEYPPEHERLALGSILCTLRQFSTVQTVEIMIEGERPEQFPGGAPARMPLGPECWINLELDSEAEDYRNFTAIKLFFCYYTPNSWIFYVPVTRILPPVEEEAEAEASIRELLEGPRRGSGLFSDIPPGTSLRRLTIAEGLATVDLSAEAAAYQGGLSGAENMVNQIVLTLTALDEVDQVQILVEGEKITLPEGLDLTGPLKPPENYNYF